MRAVNLLPRDDRRQRRARDRTTAVLIGMSGAFLVAAVVGTLSLMEDGKVTRAKDDLASIQAQLDALPAPPQGLSKADQQLGSEQTARISALATALSRRVAWDRVLREISTVLPADISLKSLKAESPVSGATQNPAVPSTPAKLASGLTLEGTTFSHRSVARFLSRLQVIPDLTNVQLVESTRGDGGPVATVTFIIAADVRPPGPAS